MINSEQTELVRLLELDYDKTTELIEGVIGSSFTIRGWGIALVSALIGLTFQSQRWEVAGLASIITLLIAFLDAYHSWLYCQILRHAAIIEHVLSLYYAYLARGDDDRGAERDFQVALLAHHFGRFTEVQKKFHFGALGEIRPRAVILFLYMTLLTCVVVSGVAVWWSQGTHAATLECTSLQGTRAYVCVPK